MQSSSCAESFRIVYSKTEIPYLPILNAFIGNILKSTSLMGYVLDTARLWPYTIFFFVINSFYLYLMIPSFPPSILLMLGYGIVLFYLRRSAEYVILTVPLLIGHSLLFVFDPQFRTALFVMIPFVIFAIIMILNLIAARREIFYFKRTVLSLNDKDTQKARKALKTGDIEDIADVAKYTDWDSVS